MLKLTQMLMTDGTVGEIYDASAVHPDDLAVVRSTGKDTVVTNTTNDIVNNQTVDRTNVVAGNYSFALGSRNNVASTATESGAFGGLITLTGENSFGFGYRVYNHKNQSIVGGYHTGNNSNESFVYGNNISVDCILDPNSTESQSHRAWLPNPDTQDGDESQYLMVFGDHHTIGNKCLSNLIAGSHATIGNNLQYSIVVGNNQHIGDDVEYVNVFGGGSNYVNGPVADSTIFGYSNTIYGGTYGSSNKKIDNVYIFGTNNKNSKNSTSSNFKHSVWMFGHYLAPVENGQFIVGEYNKISSNDQPNAYFLVGTGGGNNSRRTSFAVCYNDGDGSHIYVGATKIKETHFGYLVDDSNYFIRGLSNSNALSVSYSSSNHGRSYTVGLNNSYVQGSLTTSNRLATMQAVNDAIAALGTPIVYVGQSSTDPTQSGATVPGHTTWKKGEVVTYGNKEYILTGDDNIAANWIEFGDEGSYALKTVSITGTGYLTGGGTLEANRTIDISSTIKNRIDGALQKVTDSSTKEQMYVKDVNGNQVMRNMVVANSTGTDSVVNVTADAARVNTAGGAYSVAFGSRNVIGSSASESGAFGGDIHINSENTYGFGYHVWAHANQNLLGGYDIGSNAKESIIYGNTIGIDCTHDDSTHEWTANDTADDNKSRYLAVFGNNHTIASDCQSDLVYGSNNNIPQYVYRSAIGGNGNRIHGALDNSFVFGQQHHLGSNSSNWINVFGYNNKIGLVSPTGETDSYSGGNEDINVFGYQNRVGSYLTDSTVIGYYNKIAGGSSSGKYESVYAIGYENTNRPSSTTYQRVFMIGAYLRAEGNDRVIVGRYNDGTGLPNRTNNGDGGTFFEVGCGYDSNHRATGFAVCHTTADGYHAYLGPTKIGGSSSGLKVNGTLVSLNGHTHGASAITSGTFDIARIPTGTDANSVALGNHTHSVDITADSGTPSITLSYNTTYKLTAGGSSFVFKTPSDSNTNYYHTPIYSSGLKIGTGIGISDMYVPNGSTTAAGVLQIGTSASNAAAGNHNHDSSYVTKNTAITGNTKCKITYDSKGLVTSGEDLIASDIPSLAADKITSGTFADERIASASTWNAKYTKPSGGIPASDLAESYALSTHNHDSSYVAKNSAITSATKCKITYDSKGLVTGGADLVADDIPNLSASKITTGTFADARIASASTWNGKYTKPSGGIPASDLAESYYLSSNPNGYTSNTGTVIGSDLTADRFVLGNGTVNVKKSTYAPGPSSTTWDNASDVYLPTMKAVSNYVLGRSYIYNASATGDGLTVIKTTDAHNRDILEIGLDDDYIRGGSVSSSNKLVTEGALPTTYLKSASVSGNTLTLTKQDNGTVTYTPSFTDKYHTSGSWSDLTYTATANGGAGALAFTIPTGTSATTVALGNHTHDARYVRYDTSTSLTDAQKNQARSNIGAGTYSKPSTGIPASDLSESYLETSETVIRAVYGTKPDEIHGTTAEQVMYTIGTSVDDIVQRTTNGHIVLPNQSTYAPSDDQAVSKRWVEAKGYTTNTGTVIGSSLTANKLILGNGGVNIKNSTYEPGPSSTTWSDSSDVYIPTMKSVVAYVTGKGYVTTDRYHTSGSWSGLTYTATANGGAGALAFTIPTGTSATTVALGNHNHDASYVAKNTAITGATKCKITYDSKGLVTSGADLEASDIPSLSADKITSGTFAIARIPTGDSTSTSADFVVKCNDSRLSNSRPASDVYSWAKAATKPSYSFSEISDKYQALLSWGGPDISGGASPLEVGIIDDLGHNKFAFMSAAGVVIQYSRDGGSTWVDYGATDNEKKSLVTLSGSFSIGKRTGSSNTINDKLRIILNSNAAGGNVYTSLRRLLLNVNTNGSSGCTVKIETRTIGNYKNNVDTWADNGTHPVQGWSGWNSPSFSCTFGGGSDQTSQTAQIRLTFGVTAVSTTYNNFQLLSIRAIGFPLWSSPSTMASNGHLYSFDISQNATFPASVSATTFSENGTTLANKYLGKSATAADSSKLNGQAASYYAKATDIPSAYIKSASTSGNTLTLTKQDNTTVSYTPSFTDTNYYHSTGSWDGLTYTATANGGAPALAFTLPTGTGASQVALGNHNHDSSYVGKVTTGSSARLYGVNASNAQTMYTIGTSADNIVQRTTNGQIALPNQSTYAPGDDQVVSKRWVVAQGYAKDTYHAGTGITFEAHPGHNNEYFINLDEDYIDGELDNSTNKLATQSTVTTAVGGRISSIVESTVNGKIKFTKDGSTYTEVAVHGLGSNAFNSTTIPTTYIKSASVSGNTLTLTKQDDGTVTYTPSFTDTNQKIKAGSVTFGNNDVVDIVAGDNVTVAGLASGTGAPKITISATDTWRPVGTGANDAAAGNHVHGNINNAGTITSTAVTSATGVLVYDSSNKIQRATAASARSIIGAGTYSKPSGGIPDTDIASASTWNGKYSKPSGGIPASDLAESYYLSSNPNGYTSNTGTVIGSDLTADRFVLGNGTVNVKKSTYAPGPYSTTWDTSSDVYLPTMRAVSAHVSSRYVRYDTNAQGLSAQEKTNARTNIGAQASLPTTSTAGKVLKSTSTAGTVEWGDAGGGGTTLYRHNLEWVFKTGSSSSGYIYTHFYAYLITNSSTAYTYSTYFGSITTLFKKTVLCGGLYDYSSQDEYGYDGISTLWRPNYSRSGSLNQVYIKYAREGSSTWSEVQITSSTTAYSFTDTVEAL